MRTQEKNLVVIRVLSVFFLLLMLSYIVSFVVWKQIALRRSEEFGLIGYYFFLHSHRTYPGKERAARYFYFPLMYLDAEILGNARPGGAIDCEFQVDVEEFAEPSERGQEPPGTVNPMQLPQAKFKK